MLFSAPSLYTFAVLSASVLAKIAAGTGDFSVTVGSTTYNPASGRSTKLSNLAAKGVIKIRGVHVGYDIDCSTLGVYNYTLTGAPDAQRMVTTPTVIFTSKVATLSAAQLNGVTIKDFDLQDDTFNIIFETSAGKLKFQSKDGAQGGIFQMETEFVDNIEFVHTLGPTLFYFINSVTGKVNFGDGTNAVTTVQTPDVSHKMLLGKDSPQVANKTYQDGKTTRWSVASGGRLGGVLGEDSTELGAGAAKCTSDCQAQNRIQGSIPPTPDPINPTPIGA